MTAYQVGDRVRSVRTYIEQEHLPVGTTGTVLEVWGGWLSVAWDAPYADTPYDAPAQSDVEPLEDDEPNMVNHPAHYLAHPSGVECIAITEHMNFCLGNAVKYLWRAGLKGEALEDLRKAQFYIDREIKRLECVSVTPTPKSEDSSDA